MNKTTWFIDFTILCGLIFLLYFSYAIAQNDNEFRNACEAKGGVMIIQEAHSRECIDKQNVIEME